MRNIAPKLALGLASTLVLLVVQLPEEAMAHPLNVVIYAAMALEPLISGLVADLLARAESETVTAKVWMHTGDPKLNGCGFYFQAQGHGDRFKEGWFPRKTDHRCGKEQYRMRMTSQSAMYDFALRLGNDQVKRLEVHADGWHNTFVKTICFGMSMRTIVAGPRAFCIDNELLKACKTARNRWGNLNLEWNDILFTRTTRGIHKLIINNVPDVVQAYEAFGNDVDNTDAAGRICDNIKLIRGKSSSNSWDCSAEKKSFTSHGFGGFMYWDDNTKKKDKDPYGCKRYEGS